MAGHIQADRKPHWPQWLLKDQCRNQPTELSSNWSAGNWCQLTAVEEEGPGDCILLKMGSEILLINNQRMISSYELENIYKTEMLKFLE